MKFKDWWNTKLKVTRYPLPTELQNTKAKYVINVSDEYIPVNQEVCMKQNIKYFWSPMDEVSSDIGVNSIFGALQIMWIAEKENAEVILHCHAGANRSPTVAECYYFLRTKQYPLKRKTKEYVNEMEKMFPGHKDDGKEFHTTRLEDNINNGHLPAIYKMERFLKESEKAFLLQDEFITESKLNQIKFDCRL